MHVTQCSLPPSDATVNKLLCCIQFAVNWAIYSDSNSILVNGVCFFDYHGSQVPIWSLWCQPTTSHTVASMTYGMFANLTTVPVRQLGQCKSLLGQLQLWVGFFCLVVCLNHQVVERCVMAWGRQGRILGWGVRKGTKGRCGRKKGEGWTGRAEFQWIQTP